MSLPRYKFDPVTQKYTLLTPQEEQAKQQEGGLRAMGGGGGDASPADPSGFASLSGPEQAAFYAENPTFSSVTQAMQTAMGATLGGKAIMALQDMVSPGVPGGKTSFTTQQHSIAQGIDPTLASPVAPPGPMTVTAIAPDPAFSGLAAMNAAVAENISQAQAQQAAAQAITDVADTVASNPTAVAEAVSEPTDAMGNPTSPGDAPSGDDSGAGYGGNEFGGDVGTSADPGSMGIGGGFVRGGLIPTKRYAEGGWRRGGSIMMSQGGLSSIKRYADGGMTMSPQNYGRMGDSMLVHMNPREVAGLQSLARSQGTSLTVNPQTGYPEAFNLQALLPIIAGLALGPAGYGLTAAQAGMATAALGTVATGSLKKGLMAGLGAYGGAGLGEGLVGTAGAESTIAPGSPVLAPAPVPGVTSTYPGATPGLMPNAQVGTGGFGGSIIDPSNFANPATVATPGTVAGSTATIAPGSPVLAPPPVVPPSLQHQISPSSFTPNTALSGVSPTPDKFIGNLSGKDALKYGTAALASIPPPEFEPPQSTAMLRPYDYSFNPITGAYEPRPGDSSEILYGRPTFTPREVVPARAGGMMSSYAAGGLAAFKEGGRPKSRRLMDEKGLGGIPYYDFMGERGSNLESAEKNFAGGGTPRFLSGGGDGMSDDIPAVIGNKQPARLADGEFVIPADVVSHIGNGSSKAGAKRLYKMMADIREERTGKTRQAPAIKPDRYMPA